MPTVYAILGDANTRKSSTIRALTGAAQRGVMTIQTPTGGIDFFVQISALQEANTSPSQFIAEMTNLNCQHILVPLRILPIRGFPSGIDYLNSFASAGWVISQLVALGVAQLPHGSLPAPRFIANSASTPANQNASQIRGWWQWV